MKILLAQINTRLGDFENNTRKIISFIKQGQDRDADIVVFPELSVVGYPPEDLVEKKSFIEKNLESLKTVASEARNIAVICGYIARNTSGEGNALYNAAAFIRDGRIEDTQCKTLLPNYDVFDERRHFEPCREQRLFKLKQTRIGVTICEDAWNDKDFWGQRLYPTDPVESIARSGADLLINISASPFHVGKARLRLNMFQAISRKYRIPSLMVNLCGGNDSLIFDGSSFCLNAGGEVIGAATSFSEECILIDLNQPAVSEPVFQMADEEQIYRALVLGLRDYIGKCGFRKCLIGLSGGIDSAMVAAIAADALGADNVTGIAMPSRYSTQHSLDDARSLAENLGIHYHVIPIEPLYQHYLDVLNPHFKGASEDITEENIQARIRGNFLMALSNKSGAMVLSTGNKSELAVGYCTIYGDMCGGLSVISDVPKTMVYRIARWLNRQRETIPDNTIRKPPSAELKYGQTDQDSLPPYDILDGIIQSYVEESKDAEEIIHLGYERKTVEKVLRLIDHNEYKRRQAAPGLRVTTKAFGYGRRIPIAQGWR